MPNYTTPRYRYRPKKPLAERFWPKVIKGDGCWSWAASTDHNGYAQMSRGGRGEGMTRASRISWELHHGPIPDGLFVLHRCDNPLCVRPDHLELGNQSKNMGDAKRRVRLSVGSAHPVPRGITHWKAKLTDEQIETIRRLRGEGVGSTVLAAQFGVSRTHIKRIVRGTARVAQIPLHATPKLVAP